MKNRAMVVILIIFTLPLTAHSGYEAAKAGENYQETDDQQRQIERGPMYVTSAEQLTQAGSKLPVKSCDEIVKDYQQSCLRSCNAYKETRKTQCEAACNDSNQVRLRKTQCEASREA